MAVLGASLLGGCQSDVDAPNDQGQAGTGSLAGSSSGGTSSAGSGTAPTSGSAGTPSTGGSPAAGGSAGAPASGSGAGGGGGSGGGGVPGGGSGGASSGGTSSAGTGTGGAAGGTGGGGKQCPADATFCSGFEDNALPTGAVYKFNAGPGEWTRDFEVDTTLFKSGKSSLRVKGGEAGASGAYQMLAVPAPTGTFWVRLYIQQTDVDIGGNKHNVFGGAASTDEPNSPGMIEFAEDVGLAFNTSDDVRRPPGYGYVNGTMMAFSLPKGQWHCIEINYDSATRAQKLYVNGTLQIDATDYPKAGGEPVKIFKFGFNGLNGPPRKVWFDDVSVGPTRAGCL